MRALCVVLLVTVAGCSHDLDDVQRPGDGALERSTIDARDGPAADAGPDTLIGDQGPDAAGGDQGSDATPDALPHWDGPFCGNGAVDTGEDCDGTALGGKTCKPQGFSGGKLKCEACALDTSGCTWAAEAGGHTVQTTAMALDAKGNSYVVGKFTKDFVWGSLTLTSSGGAEMFVTKIDAKGKPVWAAVSRSIGNTSVSPSNARAVDVALDSAGDVHVFGLFMGKVKVDTGYIQAQSGSDVFVARWDSGGKLQGVKSGAVSNGSSEAFSIVADAKGNTYLAGHFIGTAGFGTAAALSAKGGKFSAPFVARLDPGGAFVWAAGAKDATKGEAYGVGFDSHGHVYSAGYFQGTYVNFGGATLKGGSGYRSFLWKLLSSGP